MKELEQYIRDVPDFPKEGVLFKDITPLLLDAKATDLCLKGLLSLLPDTKIDKVIGIEARGFFFGTMLANRLDAGFIPVRKTGKLPCKTVAVNYNLEYGNDALEMHVDAIQKGDKVLIHDDVLATGGTALAVCKLVEQLEGTIVQCNFLMGLSYLYGRERLHQYNVASLVRY